MLQHKRRLNGTASSIPFHLRLFASSSLQDVYNKNCYRRYIIPPVVHCNDRLRASRNTRIVHVALLRIRPQNFP
jgi:hypothetical protein